MFNRYTSFKRVRRPIPIGGIAPVAPIKPNALNRFSLGTKSKGLRFETDGSLVINVQHERPGDDKLSNWLPAPPDEFSLYIRAYWPLEEIAEGRWTPPAVVPA